MSTTRRGQAKAARRAEILVAAAELMAQRGFAAVRLEDIGAAVGVSGPAMYRHFASKADLLDQMLVEISERLLAGGQETVAAATDAAGAVDTAAALRRLIDFHIDVLVTKPDLIVVQDRDLYSLSERARHRVRSLQRQYVELWVQVLAAEVGFASGEARVRVQAVFGLLNSSPRLPEYPSAELRSLISAMAWSALCTPTGATPKR